MNTVFQLTRIETRVCRKNTSRAFSKLLASYAILLIWLPLTAQNLHPIWSVQETREVTEATGPVTTVVSSEGDVYIAGASNWYDWSVPTNTIGDVSKFPLFVAKLDPSGKPFYVTVIGGATRQDLMLDGAGSLYVRGLALPSAFGTSPGAYRTATPASQGNDFVCKLRAADGVILFCALFDTAHFVTAFTVDAAGSFYFAGNPITPLNPTPGAFSFGNRMMDITKVDATGSAVLWRAEFSGTGRDDSPASLAVDSQANVWIAGTAYSSDFPTTLDALISKFPAATSAFLRPTTGFLAKLNPSGTSLLYATYTGPLETLMSMSMDGLGNLYTLTSHDQVGLVRKFNSTGKAVLYERSLPGLNPFGLLVQVDQLGVVTAIGSTQNITFATYRSAESCSLAEFQPGSSDGALVRIGPDGGLMESTFLGLQEPLSTVIQSWALSVQATKLYVAVWTQGEQVLSISNTTGPHHLESLQFGPNANAGDGLRLACVGSSATLTGAPLVRGEIVSLFGNTFGSKTPVVGQPGADNRFPTTLGGIQVIFDGVPAPLLYVSDTQINAIVPWDLSGSAGTKVCVSSQTDKANCILASTTLAAPGIFQLPSGYAAVINQDGTINSADNPAHAGSTIYIYATGLGPVSPLPTDGGIVPLPVPMPSFPVETVFIGGLAQLNGQVLHAGLAPLQVAGLFQIDVKIPPVPPGIGTWSVGVGVDASGGGPVFSPFLPISLAPSSF